MSRRRKGKDAGGRRIRDEAGDADVWRKLSFRRSPDLSGSRRAGLCWCSPVKHGRGLGAPGFGPADSERRLVGQLGMIL